MNQILQYFSLFMRPKKQGALCKVWNLSTGDSASAYLGFVYDFVTQSAIALGVFNFIRATMCAVAHCRTVFNFHAAGVAWCFSVYFMVYRMNGIPGRSFYKK